MNDMWKGLGFGPADILLPQGCDMGRWSVVACDQYTSQPEYWQRVEASVGDCPSALRLILPEHMLEDGRVEAHIRDINRTMEDYLSQGLFRTCPDSLIYVERTLRGGRVRRGLVGLVDLEDYDFTPGSSALIRATEGTVLSRIPPRAAVRRDAALELPHVMLLVDDRERTVVEPLTIRRQEMETVYDFDLMEDSGHVTGRLLTRGQQEAVASALRALADPAAFRARYGLGEDRPPMLFAVGDGNHSLATAKACYEEAKGTPREALARYALVEVVNLHDISLEFEPIHRTVFGVEPEALLDGLLAAYPGATLNGGTEGQSFCFVYGGKEGTVTIPSPPSQLAVGTLQQYLDQALPQGAALDYIHGADVARQLARRERAISFLLPAMGKDELFRTVIHDGVLPRKTFSMGEAEDKRFYLEARKIR